MDPVTPRSRRSVLAGAIGGVAAAAASSLLRPASVAAADGDPVLAGNANTATLPTTLTNSTAGGTTFSAVASGSGLAVVGTSTAGRGVTGSTQSGVGVRAAAGLDGLGLWASSVTGTAVRATSGGPAAGFSSSSTTFPSLVSQSTGGSVGVVGLGGSFAPAAYPDNVGVLGDNPAATGVGVWGRSSQGTAVLGDAVTGYGVEAYGAVGVYGSGGAVGIIGDVDHATGVQGWTGIATAPTSGADVGVWAGAENGRTALKVQGVVRMNRSGRVSIGATKSSVVVAVPGGLSSTSLGFATLQTNRAGYYIQAVSINTALSQITIYLNKALATATFVAWVVIG
ncbi:MAG TPA: hypothetical protein VFY18_13390 [Candidatus Limnocylindrales bacterium]|nr:hypothetical protein [Candidatus Limnocylindrales bacterium]